MKKKACALTGKIVYPSPEIANKARIAIKKHRGDDMEVSPCVHRKPFKHWHLGRNGKDHESN